MAGSIPASGLMKVGTIVKLKIPCLGNPKGTLGIVFYDYGDGFQAIFENGNYDGFSEIHKFGNPEAGLNQSEAEYFLEEVGFEPSLADYQFKNVIRVSHDFINGVFDIVWKKVRK